MAARAGARPQWRTRAAPGFNGLNGSPLASAYNAEYTGGEADYLSNVDAIICSGAGTRDDRGVRGNLWISVSESIEPRLCLFS